MRLARAVGFRPSIETSNDIFNEVLSRSVVDLFMLMTDKPQGAIPYAGVPWYSTTFGRDAIITATEMLWMDPSIATGVLRFLAATQAKEIKKDAEAEPGKIVHEMRSGEMARLGEVPFAFYYGSLDSTPLFVILAGLYFGRTHDLALVSELWPHIEAALNWIDTYGDKDGDGFVEYQGGGTGLTNQGWKDSADLIFHADGSDPVGPIARCEVQGYAYAAKRLGAKIAAADGLAERAAELERAAEKLRLRFEEAFWCVTLAPTLLRSTGGSVRAECARRMPASCCSPASSRRNGRRRSRSSCWVRTSSQAGASGRLPRRKRATTRCPTTTARFGRTTTR